MRLFVALVPPCRVLDELDAAVRPVRALPGATDLRWGGPREPHLTLCFFGDVDAALLPAVRRRLERAAVRHAAPRLWLSGAGSFGGSHRVGDVLWTSVAGDRERLCQLADALSAAVARAGVPLDERPYRPHLTLARSRRRPVDLRPLVAALDGFTGSPWTPSRVELVHSRLGAGPGGRPLHRTLARCPLASGPRGPEDDDD